MNVKLNLYHFKELHKNGYTLDMVFLLKLVEEDHDICYVCEDDEKLKVVCQTLIRKGLISESYKITLTGKSLIKFLSQAEPKEKIVKLRVNNDDFEKWWKAYPGTDTFVHNNKKFMGTRSLRQNIEACRLKFNSILAEDEYNGDDMIKALELDVFQKKESSAKTSTNRLTYMQNTLTYLNQRTFESYIELVKSGITTETNKSSRGTDI